MYIKSMEIGLPYAYLCVKIGDWGRTAASPVPD